MSEETCEERIGTHLAQRAEHVRLLLAGANGEHDADAVDGDDDQIRRQLVADGVIGDDETDGETIREAAWDALNELPLEISTSTTLKVLISTGGPEDYLTAEVQQNRYLGHVEWERKSDVVYHFADWFDHAERTLNDDSPLVAWFDSIVEVYGE